MKNKQFVIIPIMCIIFLLNGTNEANAVVRSVDKYLSGSRSIDKYTNTTSTSGYPQNRVNVRVIKDGEYSGSCNNCCNSYYYPPLPPPPPYYYGGANQYQPH